MNTSESAERVRPRHALTPRQLAERWQCGVQTLANMRYREQGPRWIKCGRLVRYRLVDVEAYEDSQAHGGAAA